MRDRGKSAAQVAEKKERIMETAFRLFAEKGIEHVTIPQIGEESGVSRASMFLYFPSKLDLVLAIGTKKWSEYVTAYINSRPAEEIERMSGAEHMRWFMDSFLDLYRNHRDILCFNYEFNAYLRSELSAEEKKGSYLSMIGRLRKAFHRIYEKGMRDGSLRTDITEDAMFSSAFHIMLAAVTRYAVGLVYLPEEDTDPEYELVMLEELLLSRYKSSV